MLIYYWEIHKTTRKTSVPVNGWHRPGLVKISSQWQTSSKDSNSDAQRCDPEICYEVYKSRRVYLQYLNVDMHKWKKKGDECSWKLIFKGNQIVIQTSKSFTRSNEISRLQNNQQRGLNSPVIPRISAETLSDSTNPTNQPCTTATAQIMLVAKLSVYLKWTKGRRYRNIHQQICFNKF